MLYQKYTSTFSSVLSFGTIRSDFLIMEEAVLFGIWEEGPWLGFRYRTNQDAIWDWVSLGDNFMHDLQIWRHSCFTIDFESGHVTLVENGKVRIKTQSDKIKKLGGTMNHVSAGCLYHPSEYLSMYGRVTDLQIFGRILSDQEMEEITGCKSRKDGDILSWDSARWIMSGTNQNITKESLDWKTFICKSPNKSYHIIPKKINFISESLDVCKKFSAQLAGHKNKVEFAEMTQYLSSDNVLEAKQCWSRIRQEDNSLELSTWLAADDFQQEGVWTNWYSREVVSHLPWAKNRPYNVRTYNCMRLQLKIVDTGDTFGNIQDALLGDEECEKDAFCPVCSITQPILKIFARGLCKQSLYNNVYMYNIDSNGDLLYLGEKTSMISYNMMSQQWVWYDSKNNMSVATSNSSYASLLIGVHTVDFSAMVDDKCEEDGKVRKLKFTTCIPGQFTCSDGQCIPIGERCDKTEHCDDKSDEENCHITHMKSSYNKNIAPFSYEDTTKRYSGLFEIKIIKKIFSVLFLWL